MVTIELHELIFHGHHGVYAEERKAVNTFEVTLRVRYEEKKNDFESVKDVVSYVNLYEIVKRKVQASGLLLERLCLGIINTIKQEYPFVSAVTVTIYKLQAPIENFRGKVGVTMQKQYDD